MKYSDGYITPGWCDNANGGLTPGLLYPAMTRYNEIFDLSNAFDYFADTHHSWVILSKESIVLIRICKKVTRSPKY